MTRSEAERAESGQTGPDDEPAWIQAAKKDPESFQYLFNKYHDQIYNFVLRRIYHREMAQDITANTFMKALEKLHQFQYKGIPFSSWLYRIAVNEVNLVYRKRKRSIALTEQRSLHLAHDGATDDSLIQHENEMETEAQFKKIHEAVMQLKPKYQDAISLRYFEEKSIREIAEILGISENTVKTHIRRALQNLRNVL
ncbi:RNA polymerase sigma factor [bacterium]|nr:RNA polymerase sigma factor [bacterium]